MSADKATYLDSSALVKLAVREPESLALRRYLRRRRPLVASALARTEVAQALLPLGPEAVKRGHDVVARVDLVRTNDHVLEATLPGSSPTTTARPQRPTSSACPSRDQPDDQRIDVRGDPRGRPVRRGRGPGRAGGGHACWGGPHPGRGSPTPAADPW